MATLPVTAVDVRVDNGAAATPVFSFTSDPDTGLYRIAADNVGIAVGGVKKVDIGAAQVALNTGVSMKVPGSNAGVLAVGGNLYSHVLAAFGFEGHPLDYIHQVAVYAAIKGNLNAAGAGSFVIGFESAIGTQPGAFTLEQLTNFLISNVDKGAGTTITRTTGLSVVDETAGTHNAAISRFDEAFTGDWFIYYGGARASYFGGNLTVGAEMDRSVTTGYLRIWGGTAAAAGAHIVIFGSTHASLPNQMQLNATTIMLIASGGITFGNNDVRFNQPLVTMGGGAAPTLGTIGGSGPATAAQHSWKKFLDETGAACWLPVWK